MDFERQQLLRADLEAQRKLINAIIDSVTGNVTQPHLKDWKGGYIAGLRSTIAVIDLSLDHFNK